MKNKILSKNKGKKSLNYIVTLFVLMFILYICLVLAYFIPTDNMQKNLKESAYKVELPTIMEYRNSIIDAPSDSTFLLTAAYPAYPGTGNAFKDAITCSRIKIEGHDLSTEIINCFYDNCNAINEKYVSSEEYGRYWHGYLIWLKPLLAFMNFAEIRTVYMFVVLLLYTIFTILIYREDKYLLVPTFVTFIFLNPITISLSTQLFSCSAVMLFATITTLLINKRIPGDLDNHIWSLSFMVFGAITNFFDMFSYPLITLGIPLAVLLLLNEQSLSVMMKHLVKNSITWGVGYIIFMFAKIGLHYLISGKAALHDALRFALRWTGENVSFKEVGINILKSTFQPTLIVIIPTMVIGLLIMMIKNKKLYVNMLIPMMTIAIMPVVFYLIFRGHTLYHNYFTYRTLSISVFAFAGYLVFYYKKMRKESK